MHLNEFEPTGDFDHADDDEAKSHECVHCGAPVPAPPTGYDASLCSACD